MEDLEDRVEWLEMALACVVHALGQVPDLQVRIADRLREVAQNVGTESPERAERYRDLARIVEQEIQRTEQ